MNVGFPPPRKAEALAKLRAEFDPKGFSLIEHPDRDQVPEFARQYRPDALLVGPEKNFLVEFKEYPSSAEESTRSESLARAVSRHEKWGHLIVLLKPEPYDVLPAEQINRAIDEFDRPTAELSRKLAFVMAWAVFEAAARLSEEKLDPESKARSLPTAAILEKLGSYGVLEDTQVSELVDLAAIRNRIVHGGLDVEVPAAATERLLVEARELLEAA